MIISLIIEPGHVRMEFTDTGVGIPEHIVQKIGEPFFTTKSKGTGLGFLLSKRIISTHNGSMKIHSTLGKGTTVSVKLPISG